MDMVLSKKVGIGFRQFRGSVAALNTWTQLKKFFGDAGIGIEYPEEVGDCVKVARPGIGEIWIEKMDIGYEVYLQRGALSSLIASWLGKYE